MTGANLPRALLLVASSAVVGCPAGSSGDGAKPVSSGSHPTPKEPVVKAPVPKAPVADCSSDADCELAACEACSCRVFRKGAVTGCTPVPCYADPCRNSSAVCQREDAATSGKCVLVAKAPP